MIIPVTISKGSGSAFAYVIVNFPTTATGVSCANLETGEELSADAAGLARGQYVFEVPAAGEWMIGATDGTDLVTDNVTITAAGVAAEVTLTFSLVLLDGGDECTDVTGGWAKLINTTATIVNTGTGLTLTGQSANACHCYTVNKIDVSGRNTLKMHISENPSTIYSVTIGLKNVASATAWVSSKTVDKGYTGDVELDISGVTSGEYWVGISVSSTGISLIVDKVELI